VRILFGFFKTLEAGMEIYCHFCGSSKFRASHFRFGPPDLSQSLVLRFPVRCLNCGQRSYASFTKVLKLRSARKGRQRESRGMN
jgi:hypothetical protein